MCHQLINHLSWVYRLTMLDRAMRQSTMHSAATSDILDCVAQTCDFLAAWSEHWHQWPIVSLCCAAHPYQMAACVLMDNLSGP
jgi:hypothetical protein